MKLVTRSQWGARAYKQPNGGILYSGNRRGVKIHYLGTAYSNREHGQCAAYVRRLQNGHMDGNGWSDIGYSFVVCTHGYVYEGRGLRRRNSANGNTALNNQDYAVCALVGATGLTQPTEEQLHGLRDAIEYCRKDGPAGSFIGGHRSDFATLCPGAPLWSWVQDGAPRPSATPPAPSTYTFKAGDKLTEVASRFSVSVDNLGAWNNLLQVGKSLVVADPTPKPEPEPEPEPQPEPEPEVPVETRPVSATVDNPIDIRDFCTKHNLSVEDLLSWNGFVVLATGQNLTVGHEEVPAEPGPEDQPGDGEEWYTVVAGDSLAKIGRDREYPWRDIANRNGIVDPWVIHIGQKLILPVKSSTEPEEPGPGVPGPVDPTTLKGAAAKHSMNMGAAVADHLLNVPAAREVLAREYNVLTAENVMKPINLHPSRGNWNWAPADRLVNFAQENGQKVHGHTLLWHVNHPGWMNQADIKTHIETVVARYKGKVQSWDVVNEVISDSGGLRSQWNYSLIANCFRWAHAVDPDAKLYINEFNIEDGRPKSDDLFDLVEQLLQDGVPIHGVGFQCHFNTEWTPASALLVTLNRFKALGLEVAVTEFDCEMKGSTGTPSVQATHYSNLVSSAKAAGAKKFITWGFTDGSTWLTGKKPLPFDEQYNKKPAYNAMLDKLNED